MLRAAPTPPASGRAATTPRLRGARGASECQSLQPGSLGDPLTSGPVRRRLDGGRGRGARAAGAHVGGRAARDLPHLSHLAIRARQEKTPPAATEDAAAHAAARARPSGAR